MFKIHLIGICPGQTPDSEAIGLVSCCGCVFASNRHRSFLAGIDNEILPIEPVRNAVQLIRERLKSGNVAVLATGDPLFFGIGRMLVSEFGSDRLVIKPAVSSMQLAFSRFGESWDDAVFMSLHGRSADRISEIIMPHKKVFCFTDKINSPAAIARTMLKICDDLGDPGLAFNYTMMVAENLGTPEERIISGNPVCIADLEFNDPNVLIIRNNSESTENRPVFGISEDEIMHSRGLITKNEVRAASIHALRIPRTGVFWDIGAGSGSISIEAAEISPNLQIFSIERNHAEILNIRANCRKFKAFNIQIIEGTAPLALHGLPAPDCVFVGGGGGYLAEIIETVSKKLKQGGKMVLNAVTDKTKMEAPDLMHRFGLDVKISEIRITRKSFPDGAQTIMNPISVISGTK